MIEEIKPDTKVLYCGCVWFVKEKVGNDYLLRSINKNLNDVLATGQYVKRFETEKMETRKEAD